MCFMCLSMCLSQEQTIKRLENLKKRMFARLLAGRGTA